MKLRTLLTPEARQRILVAYLDGEPLKRIAARFKVDVSYPSHLARRRGLPRRTQEHRT